ncbi:transposase-like zinc-binding domain-containing protein [Raineya orbicola]
MQSIHKLNCPHCQGTNVVKNGRKKDETQNFLCKSCGKQCDRQSQC